MRFTFDDSVVACTEGWDLFDADGSNDGPLQIQRLDDMAILADDGEAWVLVVDRSSEDGPHRRALLDLMDDNPDEFDRAVHWWLHSAASSPAAGR